ncbi:acireductone synthase [Rhodovastum sp. RN2-1]|uniref:Enolase-phosphatase E1 n=1 Tax=Limobrevibacterium gyesilva TaxID=2991712 RepID=A0AA41YK83_9PROT|nr:acireductone synthase [Limobrevibacterium gyesilva]
MLPPAAILTDIEGTTTPIAFVRDVLFPFARARLPEWVETHAQRPDVAAELAEIRRMTPGKPELQALLQWMDQDAKVTPLKALQGMIWREGYLNGALKGAIYPDVPPALRRWAGAGLGLYVYSSGSVEAQKLIFGHSTAGDLARLFSGFFDTRVGGKREPDSYARLAIAMHVPPVEILFLSDVEAELDAAAAAGMRTCQLVRAEDGTEPSDRHPTAADFPGVAARMGLPGAARA